MTAVRTPGFLLEGPDGATHELDGNDRVVVLAGSVQDAHRWITDQGEYPYGQRFITVTSANTMRFRGLRFEAIVTLPSFLENPLRHSIGDFVEHCATMRPRVLRIDFS